MTYQNSPLAEVGPFISTTSSVPSTADRTVQITRPSVPARMHALLPGPEPKPAFYSLTVLCRHLGSFSSSSLLAAMTQSVPRNVIGEGVKGYPLLRYRANSHLGGDERCHATYPHESNDSHTMSVTFCLSFGRGLSRGNK